MMVDKYVPKVGDKVRATLGKSLVEGEVAEVRYFDTLPCGAWVFPNPETFDRVELRIGDTYGWQFEQIVEVPSKFGAVIRRADGVQFVCNQTGDSVPWGKRGENVWVDDAGATYGGFTVLFDGVDE